MNANDWYKGNILNGDVVTFTTRQSDDTGFTVTLDAYSDREGYLPYSELSSKKIRKNPRSFLKEGSKGCGVVTDADGVVIFISLKDVTQSQQEEEKRMHELSGRLFSMCRKLSFIRHSPRQWHDMFVEGINNYIEDSIDEHPYTILSDRLLLRDKGEQVLLPEFLDVIRSNHCTLFGIKPFTATAKITIITFDIEGNERVKGALKSCLQRIGQGPTLTDSQLYQNQDKFNITVQPVSLPDFQVQVTSYINSLCQEKLDSFISMLEAENFDCFRKST